MQVRGELCVPPVPHLLPEGPAATAEASTRQPSIPHASQAAAAAVAAAALDATCSGPTLEQPAGPQTAEQWVEFLVSEMAKCQDMGDARTRAAGVLQHFERFVKARSKEDVSCSLECSILKA